MGEIGVLSMASSSAAGAGAFCAIARVPASALDSSAAPPALINPRLVRSGSSCIAISVSLVSVPLHARVVQRLVGPHRPGAVESVARLRWVAAARFAQYGLLGVDA